MLGFSEYSSLYDAVWKIYREEGMRGYFTGLWISLVRDVPFSGIYYPIYEQTKTMFNKILKYDQIKDE